MPSPRITLYPQVRLPLALHISLLCQLSQQHYSPTFFQKPKCGTGITCTFYGGKICSVENTLKALVSNSEKNKQSRQLLESKVHSSLDYYANTFMKVTVDWLESNTMQLLVGVQSFCPMLYFAIQHQDYKTFLLVILLVNLFQNSAFKTIQFRKLLSTQRQ